MDQTLAPGVFVAHPDKPEWGLGQIQSAIGTRVTVNFEHCGKVLINTAVITLIIDPEPPDDRPDDPHPAPTPQS